MNTEGIILICFLNIIAFGASCLLISEAGRVQEKIKKFGLYTCSILFMMMAMLVDYKVYLVHLKDLNILERFLSFIS
jgi:hypothetical protein